MKHRLVILSIVIVIVNFLALAKKPDCPRADIRVNYRCHREYLRTDGKAFIDELQMILLANPAESKFYNVKCEYIDSLRSTPSGYAQWRKMMGAAAKLAVETGSFDAVPAALSNLYVFKSTGSSTTTVYDRDGASGKYYYEEPLTELQWQIGDSTKNILGYECQQAVTDFRGRHWTAWFTTEIPIQEGPWKLRGLPGLILEAHEASGQHSFTVEGIERSDEEMRPVYSRKKYEPIDRREALKALRKFLLNGDQMSRAIIQNTPDGSTIEIPDSDDRAAPDLHVDFLEADYHD